MHLCYFNFILCFKIVCISDNRDSDDTTFEFETNNMINQLESSKSGKSNNSMNSNNNNNLNNNNNDIMCLKCDDMEGTPLRIGETQFGGTCRFLTDCKILLMTGYGLSKDKNNIIVSKHATKFMLENTNDIEHKNTESIYVGNKVFIFIGFFIY